MSASEKLKALDGEMPQYGGVVDARVIALRASLPQIVAVVEWAQSPGDGRFCPECSYAQENCPTGCRRRAALTALDEALSS